MAKLTTAARNALPDASSFIWCCELCGNSYAPTSCRQKYCKDCVPNKAWRGRVLKYKLSPKLWDILLEKQSGTCALCDKPPLFVDHDHECCPGLITCGKCIRGLLCAGCNTALYYFEKENWATKAIVYIRGRIPCLN